MVKSKDIAYIIHSNDIDIDEVFQHWVELQLTVPDKSHEYEYKGTVSVKISTSLSIEIPFALRVMVDESSDGLDMLYTHLNMKYKRMYSMIDMTVKITKVNKIK
jgi:hypothetical protein